MDFANQVFKWHETYCRDLLWRRFLLIVLCIKLKDMADYTASAMASVAFRIS